MATSAQLEQEAGRTRGRIEDTLSELRTRMSPGSLMDDALGFAKENGGAEFVRNLGRQVSANPLPVALMGAALAWLMVAQNRPTDRVQSRRGSFNEWAKRTEAMTNYDQDRRTGMGDTKSDSRGMQERASDAIGSARDRASDMMGSARERASDVVGSARDRASDVMGSARDRASDIAGRARDTTSTAYQRVSQSVSSAVDTVSSAMPSTRRISNFVQEEPMVLAGVGIAVGAIIGALLPSTETEERYLGPAAGSAKEQAKQMAREQWERGKEMAAEGWDEAKEAARRTWEDAKDEAQKSWESTQQRSARSGQSGDMTGTQTPLVPGHEVHRERLADATSRDEPSDV